MAKTTTLSLLDLKYSRIA